MSMFQMRMSYYAESAKPKPKQIILSKSSLTIDTNSSGTLTVSYDNPKYTGRIISSDMNSDYAATEMIYYQPGDTVKISSKNIAGNCIIRFVCEEYPEVYAELTVYVNQTQYKKTYTVIGGTGVSQPITFTKNIGQHITMQELYNEIYSWTNKFPNAKFDTVIGLSRTAFDANNGLFQTGDSYLISPSQYATYNIDEHSPTTYYIWYKSSRPRQLKLNMIDSNVTLYESNNQKTHSVIFDDGVRRQVRITNTNTKSGTYATNTVYSNDILYLSRGTHSGQTTITFTSVDYPDLSCELFVITSLPIKITKVEWNVGYNIPLQSNDTTPSYTYWFEGTEPNNSNIAKEFSGTLFFEENFIDYYKEDTVKIDYSKTNLTIADIRYSNVESKYLATLNTKFVLNNQIGTEQILSWEIKTTNTGYASNKNTVLGYINIAIKSKKMYGVTEVSRHLHLLEYQIYFDECFIIDNNSSNYIGPYNNTYNQYLEIATSQGFMLKLLTGKKGIQAWSNGKTYKSKEEVYYTFASRMRSNPEYENLDINYRVKDSYITEM